LILVVTMKFINANKKGTLSVPFFIFEKF